MCLDRFDGDDEFVGDLGVGGSQDQPLEYLAFTVRERGRQRGIRRYGRGLDAECRLRHQS